MSLSTFSDPIQPPPRHIIKLKDHVNMKTHIETLTAKYNHENQVSYKVTHEWDPIFVNAYVGEFFLFLWAGHLPQQQTYVSGEFSADVLKALKTHADVEYISENNEIGDFEIIDQKYVSAS